MKKNKKREKRIQIKSGDKVIIRETPRTKELCIANSFGVIDGVDGEEIYVVQTGHFVPSGPYKLKIGEVEKNTLGR